MNFETTSAYITTVGPDHTIVLPDEVAIGATVAVVLMSPQAERPVADKKVQPKSLYGILSHLGGAVASTDTLDETRREMWSVWDRSDAS